MELLRIYKNKKFIAAVILLLLLNGISFFITQQKSVENFGLSMKTYSNIFSENYDFFSIHNAEEIIEKSNKFQILKSFAENEKIKAENAEAYEFFADQEVQYIQENPALYQEYKEGSYSNQEISALADFYLHFAYQLEYQGNYQSYIDSILENGKELSAKKLFSDKDSFSFKSIQKSTEDFSKNKDLELTFVNDLPVSSVLNYQIGDFLLILLCVFLVIIFLADKNVNLLINTCRNGRRMLKLRQLFILICFSVLCSFFIYISEILISLKIFNAPLNLFASVQAADMFSDCILHINFLQLFAIHILFKAIIAVMISLVIWLLISVSNSIILVSSFSGIIAAVELLLYKNISVQSNLSVLKTFNLFSLFDYRSITEYNLIPLFSCPIRADIVVWCIVLIITFITGLSVVWSAKRNYPVKSPQKAFKFFYVVINKLSVFYTKLQDFIYAGRYETFKIIHISKGLLVVIAFLLIIGFNFNTNSLVFSSTEVFLSDYYEEYGGELNDAVYDSIEKMQAELQAVEDEFNQKSKQYISNEISLDEYELAIAKNSAYDTQRKAVDALLQQLERIEQLSDTGIQPMLINEIGYNSLFFNQSNQNEILLLICAVVIIFSSVFSIEKTSNMLELNHCSKNGRRQIYFKKVLTVIPKTFVLTLISYLSFIIQINYLYKLDNLNADIHNLQCLQNIRLNITICEYIILNFMFEFIFITITAMIIVSLSVFMSQLVVIITPACLFILPSALYMVNIYSAKGISASFLFNFNSLIIDKGLSLNGFIPHFVLIAICILLLYLCQKKWCITKER